MEDNVEHTIGPSKIDDRLDCAEADDEDGDQLRRASDRTPPLGFAHPQNRGDQRTGVADPDEEDETDDVDAPVLGSIQSGSTQAIADLQVVGEDAPERHGGEQCRRDAEAARRLDQRPQKHLLVRGHARQLGCHVAAHLHSLGLR